MQNAYLGLDIGTTAVKALVVGDDGAVVAEADSPLTVSVPRPAWSEQEPEDWWRGSVTAVRTALAACPPGLRIAAIGLSGQMHSLVALDAADRVIRPSILWNDSRTAAECREIVARVGIDGLRRHVANPALDGMTAPKILWLARNEPQAYARLRSVLLPKDYVRLCLTGVKAMDPSDAAGTLLFDVAQGDWSRPVLDALDIDPAWMPPIVGSAEISGRLTDSAGTELGLPAGVPVVGGGADNAVAAVGSAVIAPGSMMLSIGTSGTVVAPLAGPSVDPQMRVHTLNHAAPGVWYLMGATLAAGSALAWWRSQVSVGDAAPSFDHLVDEAASVPVGADGLTFLPYLTGNRTPYGDPFARGAFVGLHAGHTRADMTRAVLEGITFSLLDSYRLICDLAPEPSSITGTGGGLRSAVWKQMIADAFGVPVGGVRTAGAPYGAAILAACGAGRFRSPSDGAEAWVEQVDPVEPGPGLRALYDDAYARFRSLYPALRPHFARLAAEDAGQ